MPGMRLCGFVLGVLALLFPALPANGDYTVASTFDASMEAWSPVNDVTLSWSATGGVTGGYLRGDDKASGQWWYYGAPLKFLGRKSAAYGRTLSFSIMQSDSAPSASTEPNVILASADTTLVYKFAEEPGTAWTPYTITLDETSGWRKTTVDGPAPTEAEFRAVLSNLTKLHIRGEFSDSKDTGGLDDVVLTLSGDKPLVVLPVVSRFDTDAEGWRALGDTSGTEQGISWLATGGNPGGCVTATDYTSDVWYFVAPSRFTGDLSPAYGASIRFDLRQSAVSSQFDAADVALDGEALTLVHDTAANPGVAWTSYSVPLEPAAWRVGTLTGAVATEADLRGVLSTLVGFRIRGEYRSGADTAWLDNVLFGAGGVAPGDVDGNGAVDVADVIAAIRAGAGLQGIAGLSFSDVAPRPSGAPAGYGDGRVDVLDALRILRYVRGLETVWP